MIAHGGPSRETAADPSRRFGQLSRVGFGLALVLILVWQLVTPGAGAAETRVSANTVPIDIRDAAPADPYPSTIAVSGVSGTVTRVNVTLSKMSHASPGDIDVLLDGRAIPRGTPVTFAWTAVADAVQYLFEFIGGPDPGMIGGALVVPDTGGTATVPSGIPAGTYRVRVIGLTGTGAPVGQFSATLTIAIQ